MQSTSNVFSNNKKIKPQNLKCSLTKDSERKVYKKAKHPKPLGKTSRQNTKYFQVHYL